MFKKLQSWPFFQELQGTIGKKHLALYEKNPAIRALIIQTLFCMQKKNVLVIGAKQEIRANLEFFTNELVSLESSLATSLDSIGHNTEALKKLLDTKKPSIILAPPELLDKTLPHPKTLQSLFFRLKAGQEYLFEEVIEVLEKGGYQKERLVQDKGQYAVRGCIIDFFGISKLEPIRLEFFDETLEEIKTFDVASQKTNKLISQTEISLQKNESNKVSILEYFKDPILIFEELEQLENIALELKILDQLPFERHPLFLSHTPFEKLSSQFTNKKTEIEFELCLQNIKAHMLHIPCISLDTLYEADSMDQRAKAIYEQLSLLNLQCLGVYENQKEKEYLEVVTQGLQVELKQGYISQAFVLADTAVVLPYSEFTKRKKLIRKKIRSTHHVPLSDFHELSFGDLVVHFHSGIGKYIGIEKQKDHEGKQQEFFVIEYAQRSKLL